MDKESIDKKVKVTLYALRYNKVPILAKLMIVILVAYIVSPIDLIPDFIPVLGLLDELILVPITLSFIVRLIPCEIYDDLILHEQDSLIDNKIIYLGAIFVFTMWLVFFGLILNL